MSKSKSEDEMRLPRKERLVLLPASLMTAATISSLDSGRPHFFNRSSINAVQ